MNILKNKIITGVVSILLILVSCNGQNINEQKLENAALDTIVKYVGICACEVPIDAPTPAEEFTIYTRILADSEDTKEYFETSSIKRKPNKKYIEQLVDVKVLEYSLVNEFGENMKFDKRYENTKLSDCGGLIVEGENVYYPVCIQEYLNSSYKTLKGNLKIQFLFSKNIVREIETPVDISIYENKE